MLSQYTLEIRGILKSTIVTAAVLLGHSALAATVTVQEDGSETAAGCTLRSMSGTPNNIVIDIVGGCLPQGGGSSGITIYPTTFTVTEGSPSQQASVALHTQPTANVTVNFSNPNTADLRVTPSSLTFSTTNFFQPQSVSLYGEVDTITESNENVSVTTSVSSSDQNYNGISAPGIAVTIVNSSVDPNKDTGLHLWPGPTGNSKIKTVHPNSVNKYGNARSYYPFCQENLIQWNNLGTDGCSNKGSIEQGTIFSERIPIGPNMDTAAPVPMELLLAERQEDQSVKWDFEISERPGEVRLPVSTNEFQDNANSCKKRGVSVSLGSAKIDLLRSDHKVTASFVSLRESQSCIIDVNKVYYLNFYPSAGENCGTSRVCRISTRSGIIAAGAQNPNLFNDPGWQLPAANVGELQ